jgi:hypothetical protein
MYNDERDLYKITDISEWFWNIINRSEGKRENLYFILRELTREEVYSFQEDFTNAYLPLTEPIFTQYMDVYDSEDGIRDVSYWIVSQGKDFYLKVWDDPKIISTSHIKKSYTLAGVARDVYEEQGGDIYTLKV